MDPTPLQQTVMESQEVTSPPQEVDPSAPTPSDPSSITNADQAYEPLSYDEVCKGVGHFCKLLCNCFLCWFLVTNQYIGTKGWYSLNLQLFPALPNAAQAPTPVAEAPQTNWSKHSEMRIASSVITQVCEVF